MTKAEQNKQKEYDIRKLMGIAEFRRFFGHILRECYVMQPTHDNRSETIAKEKQIIQARFYKYFNQVKTVVPEETIKMLIQKQIY